MERFCSLTICLFCCCVLGVLSNTEGSREGKSEGVVVSGCVV